MGSTAGGTRTRSLRRTLAAGLRYRWTGPAKTSPDRRHTAHPVFVLHDDGYGRVVIETRRRADDQVVGCHVGARAGLQNLRGFPAQCHTLRWRDTTTVDLTPWVGLFGDQQALLSLDLTNPGSPGTAEPGPSGPGMSSDTGLPAITVQIPDDLGARIEVIGGGPMNDIPVAYENTLHHLLEQIRTEPWQRWWMAGAEDVLEIWYDFAAAKPESPSATHTVGGVPRSAAPLPPSLAPRIRPRSPAKTSRPC